MDTRRVSSARLPASVDRKLGFAIKSVEGLLSHLPGLTRAVHTTIPDIALHHDFHPLVFFLVLLERTMRQLTYPQLSDWQKRWALHSAATIARHLQAIWDQPVDDALEAAVTDEVLPVSNSPAALNARFGGQLWSNQVFDDNLVWRAVHNAFARDREKIMRLKIALEKKSREAKETLDDAKRQQQSAQRALDEARRPQQSAQRALDQANQKQRSAQTEFNRWNDLPQKLSDWLARLESDAMQVLLQLDAEQRNFVTRAIEAIMGSPSNLCWQLLCSKESSQQSEGHYPLIESEARVWLYRPGQQLLIKEDQQWREASLIEREENGTYTFQTYDDAHRNAEEQRVELAKDNHVVNAFFHHPKGMRLCIFDPRSDSWADASVREAILDSNAHRIIVPKTDGSKADDLLMVLNPFNHSPLRISSREYEDALRKYRSFVQTRYSFITDVLTGERLSIEDQIIKIEVLGDNAGDTFQGSGYDRLLALAQPNTKRNCATRNVRRALIEAEAAAGKTVMMRQVIHHCCKWNHRDQNDTVPILVLVIDLQRSMAKFAKEYANADDLVAVFLRLHNDSRRFDLLIQVFIFGPPQETAAFPTEADKDPLFCLFAGLRIASRVAPNGRHRRGWRVQASHRGLHHVVSRSPAHPTRCNNATRRLHQI